MRTIRLLRSNLCRNTCGLMMRRCSFSNIPSNLGNLLQPSHFSLIDAERKFLSDLYNTMYRMNSSKEILDLLADTNARINDLFVVVVVGEFNAGKSTFINSLLGNSFLKDGVLPTTAKICLLRAADRTDGSLRSRAPSAAGTEAPNKVGDITWRKADNFRLDDVEEMDLPVEWMKHVAIIDTPGTNALVSRHGELTSMIIPRADLVLFVTSAERPMAESESKFLSKINQWGKKVIVIVNKIDVLRTEAEQTQVVDYVRHHVSVLLGRDGAQTLPSVPIFAVSSRLALEAKLVTQADPALSVGAKRWHESRLQSVEEHLKEVLGHDELIRSKLENPLTVADRVIADALHVLEKRRDVLHGDKRVLEMIDESMELFKADLIRDATYHKRNVENVLLQMRQRSDEFLDEKVSVLQPFLMLDQEAFKKEYQRAVITDIQNPIQDVISEVSSLLAQRARSQASTVLAFVGNRPRRLSEGLSEGGSIPFSNAAFTDSFDGSRLALIERLQRSSAELLRTHDLQADVAKMTSDIRSAMIGTAAVEVTSAIGVGLALAHVLDITGLVAASTFAATGLFLLPHRKAKAKEVSFRLRLPLPFKDC